MFLWVILFVIICLIGGFILVFNQNQNNNKESFKSPYYYMQRWEENEDTGLNNCKGKSSFGMHVRQNTTSNCLVPNANRTVTQEACSEIEAEDVWALEHLGLANVENVSRLVSMDTGLCLTGFMLDGDQTNVGMDMCVEDNRHQLWLLRPANLNESLFLNKGINQCLKWDQGLRLEPCDYRDQNQLFSLVKKA